MDAAIIIKVSVFLVVLGLLGFIMFQMRKVSRKNYVTSHGSFYTKDDSKYSPYYNSNTSNVTTAPPSSKDNSDKKSTSSIDTDLCDGGFDGGGSSFDWD